MSKPDKNSFLYFFVRTIVTVLVVLALLVTHPTAHFDAVSNLDTVTQLDTNRMLDMVKQSKRDTRTMITNNVGVSDTNRLDILENLALLAKQGHQLYMNYR